MYLVEKNYIWMYNKDGDSLRSFNSNRYGNITHLDVTDPYKILVFFRDYNLTLFLDNFLSENGSAIDMQELGFDQATLVCLSREKGFWVFDQLRQKVFRLNEDFEITHQTVNFNQWFGKQLQPNYMIQYNNRLYLNEPESGIYVFDHFGTYLKKIPLLGLQDLQLLEKSIGYNTDSTYCNYELEEFETYCQQVNLPNLKDARKEKGRFYALNNKKCVIYRSN
jgi:hypothetical protein